MLPGGKNTAGLDEYQVLYWRAWYAHITVSMAAPSLRRRPVEERTAAQTPVPLVDVDRRSGGPAQCAVAPADSAMTEPHLSSSEAEAADESLQVL